MYITECRKLSAVLVIYNVNGKLQYYTFNPATIVNKLVHECCFLLLRLLNIPILGSLTPLLLEKKEQNHEP